jgi:D-hexose-6-phosphate mutarotase
MKQHEIPGHIKFMSGNGGLTKVVVTTKTSMAEIYPHGAHVTGFQKYGEPPLLFMSAKSYFAPGKPIRGGVPVILPWFGNRDGEPSHGFARITEWELTKTFVSPSGAVVLTFRLPEIPERLAWKKIRTEFMVTVWHNLEMILITTNDSPDAIEIENCLHTYFHVGGIGAVYLTGLRDAPFNDFAAGDTGTRKVEHDPFLRIAKETNRVYPDNTATVEIHDESLKRMIRVEKFNSQSTVVWNPWTTQKLPDDFDPAEHKHMVCVESGNVKQNKISLTPGATATLNVVLSSTPLK